MRVKPPVRSSATTTEEPDRTGVSEAVLVCKRDEDSCPEARLQTALRRNPRDRSALRGLADIAHQSGRFAEVVRLLQGNCQAPGEYGMF